MTSNDKQTDSNLVTIGAEIQATDKLQFSVKREQNLGDADPTYPTQTTLGATYQVNALTKLFFTQRLAAAPIVPIADFTANGFAGTQSRRETAIGVETRFGKYTAMTGRYQLENGINGTDSFAVIGLQNRLPINKKLSLDVGFERGFHLAGPNESFNSATVGFGWQPNSDFRASARYEYRDRGGVGQLFSVGAAGKLREGITALSRFQFSRGSFAGRSNETTEGMAALAIRPIAFGSFRTAVQLHSSFDDPGDKRNCSDARSQRFPRNRRLSSADQNGWNSTGVLHYDWAPTANLNCHLSRRFLS